MSFASSCRDGYNMIVNDITVLGKLTLNNPDNPNETNDIQTNLIEDVDNDVQINLNNGQVYLSASNTTTNQLIMQPIATSMLNPIIDMQTDAIITSNNAIDITVNSTIPLGLKINANSTTLYGGTNQIILQDNDSIVVNGGIQMNNGQVINGNVDLLNNSPLNVFDVNTTNFSQIFETGSELVIKNQSENATIGLYAGETEVMSLSNTDVNINVPMTINGLSFITVKGYGSNYPGNNIAYNCNFNNGSYAMAYSYIITQQYSSGCLGIINVVSNVYSCQVVSFNDNNGTLQFQINLQGGGGSPVNTAGWISFVIY